MKLLHKARKALIFLPIVILVVALVGFLIINFSQVKGFAEGLLGKTGVIEQSHMRVFIEGQSLKMQFDVAKKDKERAKAFSDRLGVSGDWLGGVSFDLDQETLANLSSVLPLDLNIEFLERGVEFSGKGSQLLSSSLGKSHYEMATGSAKLLVDGSGVSDFSLETTDPLEILSYATTSGQLNLSPKLDGLFPTLGKIAKIEIKVKGKNVTGEVTLK